MLYVQKVERAKEFPINIRATCEICSELTAGHKCSWHLCIYCQARTSFTQSLVFLLLTSVTFYAFTIFLTMDV